MHTGTPHEGEQCPTRTLLAVIKHRVAILREQSMPGALTPMRDMGRT